MAKQDKRTNHPIPLGFRIENRLVAIAGALLSILYLSNLGAGVIEFLPDAFPIIGHMDEATATLLLISCIRSLRSPRQSAETSLEAEDASEE